jgi:hypothetical protein
MISIRICRSPHSDDSGSLPSAHTGSSSGITPAHVVGKLEEACEGQPAIVRVMRAAFLDQNHPLNLRAALLHPQRSSTCLSEIREIAGFRPIDEAEFQRVVERCATSPARLFQTVVPGISPEENAAQFNQRFRVEHPSLAALSATPTADQQLELEAFVDHIRGPVIRALRTMLKSVAGEPQADGFPVVHTRAKDGVGIMDKIARMQEGSATKTPRPGYTFSDMPDSLGGRITVMLTADTSQSLEDLTERFEQAFALDILERDSFYANSAKRLHPYRVVTYTLGIDGCRAEVQITSLSASIAADLAHNTLHKPYLPLEEGENEEIMLFWRKATVRELEILEKGLKE